MAGSSGGAPTRSRRIVEFEAPPSSISVMVHAAPTGKGSIVTVWPATRSMSRGKSINDAPPLAGNWQSTFTVNGPSPHAPSGTSGNPTPSPSTSLVICSEPCG